MTSAASTSGPRAAGLRHRPSPTRHWREAPVLPWSVRSSSVAALDGQLPTLSATPHPRRGGRVRSSGAEGLRTGQGFSHAPVMLDEVLEVFAGLTGGTFLDATVGGGGHAAALLEAHPDLRLIGIDRDGEAIEAAAFRLARFSDRVQLLHATFAELERAVTDLLGDERLAGVLFDLGVSAPQFDHAERGFSYRFDGPLDMRMDRSAGPTAAELINTIDAGELETLLREHGETRFARRITQALVANRPFARTLELAEAVADAIPAADRRRGHPARRVFQALRVAVNGELEMLPAAIDAAVERTRPGGRVAVLAYHSGEDRIVKARFGRFATGGCTCPPGLPCVCGALATGKLLTRGARLPSEAEVGANPRAEAARLRVLERIEPTPVRRSR